jgi:hypothetical protein
MRRVATGKFGDKSLFERSDSVATQSAAGAWLGGGRRQTVAEGLLGVLAAVGHSLKSTPMPTQSVCSR